MTLAEQALGDAVEDPEALLVRRAKQRLPSAWIEIYQAHYQRLVRYCYARTGSRAAAADLASKVYLKALEGIDRYVYRGRPLLAWLYRIAHNVVADYQRDRQRETRALESAAAVLQSHDPGPASPVGDRVDLLAAMSRLTDDQQQVIALRYYAGLSTPEICHAMQRSEKAVYSLQLRALAALRALLTTGRDREAEAPGAENSPPFRS